MRNITPLTGPCYGKAVPATPTVSGASPRPLTDGAGHCGSEQVGNCRGSAGESVLLSDTEIVAASIPPRRRKCGIYFLIKDEELKYVGQSIDVDGRLADHRWREFDRWHWVPCAAEDLDSLERRYLDAFLPTWNSDPSTVARRREREPTIPFSLPEAAHPLDGIDPELWSRCCQEMAEYDAAHWTEHLVNQERMRRVRAMRPPSIRRMEDFGPMPRVGDPLCDF